MKRTRLIMLPILCCVFAAAAEPLRLAAMTSLIASAAQDVAGEQVAVVDFLPPGGCPGHFDLTPAQAAALREADVWLRHDYQGQLKLPWGVVGGMRELVSPGSFLIPAHYGVLAHDVAEVLVETRPLLKDHIEGRLAELDRDVANLSENWRRQAKPWKGKRVVASHHQREFCRWLGFEVVAVLPPGDELTPRDWAALMNVKADLVVANLQSDAGAGQALARQLKLPLALLSNFPGAPGYGADYRDLARANLAQFSAAFPAN